MRTTPRGRPSLNLDLVQILKEVRSYGRVIAAARELGCSDAYIHVRMKRAGLTLSHVLESSDPAVLLHGCK